MSARETALNGRDSSVLKQGRFFFILTEKLHVMLKEEGGIKALLGMVRSGNSDVIAQVARGLANFAKCESRRIIQGLWLLSFLV